MNKKIAFTLFFLWVLMGWSPVSADDMYYVYMQEGGVDAFPKRLLASEPQTSADGTLQLVLSDGQSVRFASGTYTECTDTPPELPFLTSFKFNNKYNLHLHQDVEVADSLFASGKGTMLTLVLNAIGKRLTPSFKTNDKAAAVYVDGIQVISKESRLRFDHDITFTVTYPHYKKLSGKENGQPVWEPFGNDYVVHTEWLTDNPNNVPRIDINIDGGKIVTDKTTFLHANFRLRGYGVYDDLQEEVWIRGRGNDSWTWPKKPYRLKFDKKVKPFGLTGGKSWVLLSNYYRYSMLANPIAMKMAQLVGTPFPNHIIPVELYVNGIYQGSYQFTEKVGFGANSIDGDSETGYLLEFDSYYDEPYRFRSDIYDLPVNIREPDFTEWESRARTERLNQIKEETNALMTAISRKSDMVYALLDVPSFARSQFVFELTNNHETDWPKSVFAYKEDLSDPDAKLTFGPVWDFDWAFGGGGDWQDYWTKATEYTPASWAMPGTVKFRNDIKSLGTFQYHYYKVWSDFMHSGNLDELCEFIQDYYTFARVSFEHNATRWSDGKGYESQIAKAQNWLRTRASFLYKKQAEYDISEYGTFEEGDVNGDGLVTVTDAYLVFSYIMGNEREDYHEQRADVNHDKRTNVADVSCIVRRALTASRYESSGVSSPSAGRLQAETFEVAIGETAAIPITLSDVEDAYCALQMDVVLPEGLVLEEVTSNKEMVGFTVTTHALSDGRTRILIMPQSPDAILPTDPITLQVRSENATAVPERTVALGGARLTTVDGDEHPLTGLSVSFEQTTGIISSYASTLHAAGGTCIVITALEEQDVTITSVDGRIVRTVHVLVGENVFDVPSGMYIVADKKVVVL